MNIIEKIKKILEKGNVIALTGAGISEESGISTFRGKGGIWEKFDTAIYANIPGLIGVLLFKPSRMRDFILEFYDTIYKAKPNKAHYILSEMEKSGILNSVITQNVDNLHQKAGSKNVIELHRNMLKFRCMNCNKKFELDEGKLEELIHRLKRASRREIIRLIFPKCECGGRYRVNVVLFGESLPTDELSKAYTEIGKARTLLLIGTSGIVYPAASLPYYAKERDVKIIEINLYHTALSHLKFDRDVQ
jgi:NAD-dependent deacetylase